MPSKLYTYLMQSLKAHNSDECLLWPFSCMSGGRHGQAKYGQIGIRENGKNVNYRVHRVAYEMARGPIPDGCVVRHSCDQTRCYNPRHLTAGTQKQNIQDAIERGRFLPKGSHHNMAKLNEFSVRCMRHWFASDPRRIVAKYEWLAENFHVSVSCIQQVIERKRWTHV